MSSHSGPISVVELCRVHLGMEPDWEVKGGGMGGVGGPDNTCRGRHVYTADLDTSSLSVYKASPVKIMCDSSIFYVF